MTIQAPDGTLMTLGDIKHKLTDAEREKVHTLSEGLDALLKGNSVKINLITLVGAVFKIAVDAGDDAQQACALMQNVSDEILRTMEAIPDAWSHLKHPKSAIRH
jgi:hypothetical protein